MRHYNKRPHDFPSVSQYQRRQARARALMIVGLIVIAVIAALLIWLLLVYLPQMRPALAHGPHTAGELAGRVIGPHPCEKVYSAHPRLTDGLDECYGPITLALTSLPLRATHFDPAKGGINCGGACTHVADGGTWHPSEYGHLAACIRPWLHLDPADQLLVVIPGTEHVMSNGREAGPAWRCRDTGGGIRVDYDELIDGWVIRIDLMLPGTPPHGDVAYFFNWHLERAQG